MKDKKYRRVRDHCHYKGDNRDTANSICNLKCSVVKEVLIVFHTGSFFFCLSKKSQQTN